MYPDPSRTPGGAHEPRACCAGVPISFGSPTSRSAHLEAKAATMQILCTFNFALPKYIISTLHAQGHTYINHSAQGHVCTLLGSKPVLTIHSRNEHTTRCTQNYMHVPRVRMRPSPSYHAPSPCTAAATAAAAATATAAAPPPPPSPPSPPLPPPPRARCSVMTTLSVRVPKVQDPSLRGESRAQVAAPICDPCHFSGGPSFQVLRSPFFRLACRRRRHSWY